MRDDSLAPKTFEPRNARVVQLRRWLFVVSGALSGAMGLVVALYFTIHLPLATAILGHMNMLAMIAALNVPLYAAFLFPKRRSGLLRITTAAVSLDDVDILPLAKIRQATRSGSTVTLATKRGGCQVELGSEVDAETLVAALSKDVLHATASFSGWGGGIRQQRRRWLIASGTAILAPFGPLAVVMWSPGHLRGVFVALSALLCALPMALVATVGLTRITVGIDGLLVGRVLRKPAFYPYSVLRDVEREGNDLLIKLHSDEVVRLGFEGFGKRGRAQIDANCEALVERIREARARHTSGESPSDLASVLVRGGRDLRGWVASLGALLRTDATYRTPAIPPDRLWRVLEDPTQPATTRAAAAVALRGSLGEQGKGRLRVATDVCASAELRRAFEAVGGGDEEAIEKAMSSIDEAGRRLTA